MGPVTFFSLCLLGCLIFNPSLEASPRREHSLQPGSGIKATGCRQDWLRYRDHCFMFFPEKETWEEAEVQCQDHHPGAHLASILSQAERDVVARYLSKSTDTANVWIGLHKPSKAPQDKTWVWIDGSVYRYRTWAAGKPDNIGNNEYCVEVWASSGYKNWNDVHCDRESSFLCMYSL
ncbi:C-type lectin mannose-binding isoform-like [Pelodiscus sinensis]|uniref:C-type lectin mannose-binding isoform-like n=1 Tax=Pelodiscus sinensis TaxID=13735 RepID=UPI003F6CB22D